MSARSLNLPARITVVLTESLIGFQELGRQHMLCIAPHSAIERNAIDLALATRASSDELGSTAQASGALAANNPRPKNILRRALARIEALRRIGPQKDFAQTAPVEPLSGTLSSAPEPYSMRLRPHIRVPPTSPGGIPIRTQEEPEKNPPEPTENPPKPGKTRHREWFSLAGIQRCNWPISPARARACERRE